MNSQKSVVFLHTGNEKSEKEIKKIVTFLTANERICFLGKKLTKDINDYYMENYKNVTGRNSINENKWKHFFNVCGLED